jgi:hypothetical protein
VGRDANNTGAFAGLFRRGATGVVFSQGTLLYTLPSYAEGSPLALASGAYVIAYRSVDTGGAERFDTLPVSEGEDGKLRFVGNQFNLPGAVNATHQKRLFLTLDQSNGDYYSTGYNLFVPNLIVGPSGSQYNLFNRVVVTTPRGNTLVLRPRSGLTYLALNLGDDPTSSTGTGTQTNTNFIRLRAEFVTARPGVHPRQTDNTLAFVQTDWTEEQLAQSPALGGWKFDYYFSTEARTNLSLPQMVSYTRRNQARALSIAELRQQGLATLTDGLVEEIQSEFIPDGQPFAGRLRFYGDEEAYINYGEDGSGDGWQVATGQLPPTSVELFGGWGPSTIFNEFQTVRSTERKTTIPCSPSPGATLIDGKKDHCVGDGPLFNADATLSGLSLVARDAAGRTFTTFYAFYKLATP